MTLQEIRDKKRELEYELCAAIKKFQLKTGINVVDIRSVTILNSLPGGGETIIVEVELERL